MKILISEQNQDIRNLYKAIVSPYHLDVTFANNNVEAQQAACSDQYDLIFLEFGFPDLDATSMAEKIGAYNPVSKVVLVSSIPVSESLKHSIASKLFVQFVMKPFDITRIRNIIRNAMQSNVLPFKPIQTSTFNQLSWKTLQAAGS